MSTTTIELTREDLLDWKKNKYIIDIEISDFKAESISKRDLYTSDYVVFKTDKTSKVLKYNRDKVEKPILTTDDGMKMFAGDNVWMVFKDWRLVTVTLPACEEDMERAMHFFSSQESALECIEQHKPKYSQADLEEIKELARDQNNVSLAVILTEIENSKES